MFCLEQSLLSSNLAFDKVALSLSVCLSSLQTLDRLPLTNPEHFGTPVIGKKGNRGRRSNPMLLKLWFSVIDSLLAPACFENERLRFIYGEDFVYQPKVMSRTPPESRPNETCTVLVLLINWPRGAEQNLVSSSSFLIALSLCGLDQEEELSSSSSEEEDGDQRPNEDLFGKVVCVEGVVTGDKRKTTWYPALCSFSDCLVSALDCQLLLAAHAEPCSPRDPASFGLLFLAVGSSSLLPPCDGSGEVQEPALCLQCERMKLRVEQCAEDTGCNRNKHSHFVWLLKINNVAVARAVSGPTMAAAAAAALHSSLSMRGSDSHTDRNVISPDCHDDVTLKKDNVFVRSFKDGKFHMVLRKDLKEINPDSPPKADASLKPALDAALEFLVQLVVPSGWKTEVKEESSSSEEDDEEEEEEQEEDANRQEEEEEVEPYPEEKDNFLQQLYKFMEDRGTPINKRPVLGYRNLNLFKLYRLVQKLGGFDNIESGRSLETSLPRSGNPDTQLSGRIQCQMCLPQILTAPVSSSEELKTPDETGLAQSTVCKEEKPELHNKVENESSKSDQKENNNNNHEEADSNKGDADEGSSSGRLGPENLKRDPTRSRMPKTTLGVWVTGPYPSDFGPQDDSSQEGEEGEEFECYPPGMKVQVRYGRGRSLKTYQATVKEADVEGGEVLYLVHYCGWNIRYDEWVKADKILRPANKNVTKVKHRRKIKNKGERERDRLERLNQREGLGLSRGPRSKCLSQDVFSKMDDSEDRVNQQSPAKSIEITSILNGLQASEMSTDESEREEEEPVRTEEERPGRGRKGPSDPCPIAERWEAGAPPEGSKPAPAPGKSQDAMGAESNDTVKRRNQTDTEPEVSSRKRKSEGALERTPKGHSKAKTRSTRSADWLPGTSPRKQDRGPPPGGDSSSSEDESTTDAQPESSERGRPKNKGAPSKKYNGMKEKNKAARQSGFWEIPEKRTKTSPNSEGPAVRSKGQKDVWSSIQAQWPKKTLKELFSDSDTEAANSPPPPVPSCLSDPQDAEGGPEDEVSEEQMDLDKQEFPSSGSNSVLNTPPSTPGSPSGGGSTVEDSGPPQPPSPRPVTPPTLPQEPVSDPLPPGPTVEEGPGRSESDSSTVEVESLGGEQDLPQDEGAGSPPNPLTPSERDSLSHTVSALSSFLASVSQKRQKESQPGAASKKHKPNRKSLGVPPKKNRKTANSSDSEDQCVTEAKPSASKNPTLDVKSAVLSKCPGRSPPPAISTTSRVTQTTPTTRGSTITTGDLLESDLEKMNSLERISFLQEKLQDIRNHYLSLKSEVASIDRRRKRMKKKERESAVAACSSSSSSSSPSSSSLTAAVMLTLADPPVSSSSSQTSGVSVECRKRRSDPNFKQKLRERRRQQKSSAERSGLAKLPDLKDAEAVQKFFLEEIQLGEELLSQGEFEKGVDHLTNAIAVCGQPQQLLQVLQQTLPPPVFQMLLTKLPSISQRIISAQSLSEDDVE
ncbi:hypothetical protein WMY93_018727 [Mugilogobius chulae]|uniref:ARID domain-containing protein n=1 Tax=Mugilogobius chulae TaxID=88201 RepID=A0AAW0NMI4_9GOBI